MFNIEELQIIMAGLKVRQINLRATKRSRIDPKTIAKAWANDVVIAKVSRLIDEQLAA